ncbi:hypothetical protein UlMin_038260 [Ulmus minor]
MNILAWNVQGLGNDWTFQILHDYVQQYSPLLVFLSETLCSKSQMERWRVKLDYTGMLIWEKEGRSGGLCLFWSDSITVQLLSGSKGHIDVKVTSPNSSGWCFTGLYGNPDTSLRSQFWNLLRRLGDSSSMPWLCGGDLNEILFGHEKQGGVERAQYLMSNFREAINYCGLADLGFRGPKFTWNRGNGACLVQERLDRMLGNCGWLDLFPNSLVHHLNLRGSDHRPLLVELLRADERSIIGNNWKRGRFHFEEAWADEEECSNIIKNHWSCNPMTNLDGVATKLRLCASDLEGWNLESFSRLKMQGIERKVTPQQNEQMDQAFVAEDVKTAVFQMAPTKSPGADGMSAIFYQKFWPIVGEEITAACLGFANGGPLLGSINETIITLLPKVKNPTRITEFRPISLCNVIYKIISKMLANRLRRVMGTIISEEQSAFIPGRLITDNAIIGFESFHAIKRRKTKKNYLALKLDMAKAYDRVEWEFIQRMMTKLGFSDVWIKKIMACISSVTYSFQFNGKRFGHLTPSRGLRQGDPLSPYLFLLCGEGLSSLLHRYEQNEDLQGLRCGIKGPTISHLLFADDSLFFLEAKLTACAAVKEILKLYEAASGQNKQGLFSSIRDRVWNKLCGWKSKLLSAGGREVLSKAIIQAIPTYAMNLFKLPSSLIKELHRLCAQFWWGGEPGKRKMHWCTWEKLCSHKADGGMGFRDLRLFNKAILAKQAWRIHSQPTSLVARVLQGFYFHKSSFLQVKVNSSSSFIWRSILWGRELYKQGLR